MAFIHTTHEGSLTTALPYGIALAMAGLFFFGAMLEVTGAQDQFSQNPAFAEQSR